MRKRGLIKSIIIAMINVVAFAEAEETLFEIPQVEPNETFSVSADFGGPLIKNNSPQSVTIKVMTVSIPGLNNGNPLGGFWGISDVVALGAPITQTSFLPGESFIATIPSSHSLSIYAELARNGLFVDLPLGDKESIKLSGDLEYVGDQYQNRIGRFSNGPNEDPAFKIEGRVVIMPEPVAVLQITNFSSLSDQSGFRLEFTADPGREYAIQGKKEIGAGEWQTVAATFDESVLGVATILKTALPSGSEEKFFFRVVALPNDDE